jgi:peptide/nickel transport system permease protein
MVGFTSVVGAATLGVWLGLLAGYFGGRVDTLIMRCTDVFMAFPFILLALATIAILGPSLQNMVIVFVVTGWMVYARVTRASSLSLKETEFIAAARALGAGSQRIIFRHILPNLVSPLAVLGSFQVASLITAEAALSFLGLGVSPPTPSWGSMLADGRGYVQVAWWISTLPGAALAITVLGVNLLGDGLRDALDVQLERHTV